MRREHTGTLVSGRLTSAKLAEKPGIASPHLGLSPRRCPACRGRKIRPSHRRNAWERAILSKIAIYPFRCGDCRVRYFALRPREARRRRLWEASILTVEQPRAPRWACQEAVEIRVPGASEGAPALSGLALNLSDRGALLMCDESFSTGAPIMVAIPPRPPMAGTVRWCHEATGLAARCLMGVAFEETIPPPPRVRRAIRRARLRLTLRRARVFVAVALTLCLLALATSRAWNAFQGYAPTGYEPKDIERQLYELQRLRRQ